MAALTREELFTLLARFWALANDAEGADGPDRALATIEREARAALDAADVAYSYPDWYESPEDYHARKETEWAEYESRSKEDPPCS